MLDSLFCTVTKVHGDSEPLRPNQKQCIPVSRETYEELGSSQVDMFYYNNYPEARRAHVLNIDGHRYTYSKLRFWTGGNARCYVAADEHGGMVAIKEMRRTPYYYGGAKAATKPKWQSDRAIEREYATCQELSRSLKPVAMGVTATKAYMVLPMAHIDAMAAASHVIGAVVPGAEQQSAAPTHKVATFTGALLRDVCAHLAAMHARGVMHNDMKLNNVLFCDSVDGGVFELADFGMSYNLLAGDQHNCNIFYGAPEALFGRTWFESRTDARALTERFKEDCFGLGLSCLWLVMGGSAAFETLLPPALQEASVEAQLAAYRAFEYARLAAVGADAATLSAYAGDWAATEQAFSGMQAILNSAWERARTVLPEELLHVVAGLLAHDPQHRLSAADALVLLPPAPPEEASLRAVCAAATLHPNTREHLFKTIRVLAATQPEFNP